MTDRLLKNEGRFRIWLPPEKRWIREALTHVAAMRENEGTPSSASNEAVLILEKALRRFKGGT